MGPAAGAHSAKPRKPAAPKAMKVVKSDEPGVAPAGDTEAAPAADKPPPKRTFKPLVLAKPKAGTAPIFSPNPKPKPEPKSDPEPGSEASTTPPPVRPEPSGNAEAALGASQTAGTPPPAPQASGALSSPTKVPSESPTPRPPATAEGPTAANSAPAKRRRSSAGVVEAEPRTEAAWTQQPRTGGADSPAKDPIAAPPEHAVPGARPQAKVEADAKIELEAEAVASPERLAEEGGGMSTPSSGAKAQGAGPLKPDSPGAFMTETGIAEPAADPPRSPKAAPTAAAATQPPTPGFSSLGPPPRSPVPPDPTGAYRPHSGAAPPLPPPSLPRAHTTAADCGPSRLGSPAQSPLRSSHQSPFSARFGSPNTAERPRTVNDAFGRGPPGRPGTSPRTAQASTALHQAASRQTSMRGGHAFSRDLTSYANLQTATVDTQTTAHAGPGDGLESVILAMNGLLGQPLDLSPTRLDFDAAEPLKPPVATETAAVQYSRDHNPVRCSDVSAQADLEAPKDMYQQLEEEQLLMEMATELATENELTLTPTLPMATALKRSLKLLQKYTSVLVRTTKEIDELEETTDYLSLYGLDASHSQQVKAFIKNKEAQHMAVGRQQLNAKKKALKAIRQV